MTSPSSITTCACGELIGTVCDSPMYTCLSGAYGSRCSSSLNEIVRFLRKQRRKHKTVHPVHKEDRDVKAVGVTQSILFDSGVYFSANCCLFCKELDWPQSKRSSGGGINGSSSSPDIAVAGEECFDFSVAACPVPDTGMFIQLSRSSSSE